MRRMNEKGLTLVELLAVLVIVVIIGGIAYSVLLTGFKTYDRVKVESNLRDEADLIMAEIIKDVFVLKESEIEHKRFPDASNNYYLETDDGNKYGFIDGKLFLVEEQKNVLQSELIKLSNDTKIEEIDKGQYRITLSLEWTENGQKLTMVSEIGTIKDSGG